MAANGDICVNTLKKDWTPDVTIKHILQVIRCLLIVPFPESSLNDEAGKLFMESYDEFARRARIMTDVHASSGGGGACAVEAETVILDGEAVAQSYISSKSVVQSKLQIKAKEAKAKSLKRL